MMNRVEDYIEGKMSDKDRLTFEKELEINAELKEAVELHRAIVRAIRMKAAKEHLQRVEREIQIKERRRKIFAISRYISIGAIAACIIVGIFIHFDTASDYRQCGADIQLITSSVRGGDSYADRALEAIESGHYDLALTIIEEGEKVTFVCEDIHPELVEQARQEYIQGQDDLRWYKAVTYMRMGKYFKAKRLLKQIATSDSYYKTVAQEVLKKL